MTETPLVSIVVPVYNSEKYLQQCINSLLAQTYESIEVICVNDGSTDGSLLILEKYAELDSRLKIVNISNSGVSNARNVGLRYVSGSMVMFVDSDDWINRDCVGLLVKFSLMNACDVVMFPYMSERSNSSLKRELFDDEKLFIGEDCRKLARLIIGPIKEEITSPTRLDSYGTIWGKLYNSYLLDGIEFVDLSQIGSAEDSLYNMFVFKRANVVGYFPHTFYHYRRNNQYSLTGKEVPQFKEKRKYMYSIISDSFRSEDEQEALASRIAIDVLGLLIKAFNSASPNREINNLLNDIYYHTALQRLNITLFPLHWKFFYFVATNRCVWLTKIMLWSIEFIRCKCEKWGKMNFLRN